MNPHDAPFPIWPAFALLGAFMIGLILIFCIAVLREKKRGAKN